MIRRRHEWIPVVVAVVLVMGIVAACSGDDDDTSAPPTTAADGTDEGDADGDTVTGPPLDELDGEALFVQICAACHQPEGAGIEGVFPKLADNAFVALAEPAPVASTVIHGRAGMPGFGSALTDTEIAAILTYLRAQLNDADDVSPEVVAAARQPQAIDEEPRDEDEGDIGEEDTGD